MKSKNIKRKTRIKLFCAQLSKQTASEIRRSSAAAASVLPGFSPASFPPKNYVIRDSCFELLLLLSHQELRALLHLYCEMLICQPLSLFAATVGGKL